MIRKLKGMRGYGTHMIIALCALMMVLIIVIVYRHPNTRVSGFGYPTMFMITEYEKNKSPESEGSLEYTFDVPEGAASYGRLYLTFYIRHAFSQVTVDGTEDGPWEYEEADTYHIGKTPGNYWQSATILPEYAGKTVHVLITPSYGSLKEDPQFIITDRYMSMYMQMHYDRLLLAVSIIVLLSGVFQMILGLFMPYDKGAKLHLFYLGALAAATGLWKLMGIPILTLAFSEHAQCFYYAGICAYFLIPVFAVLLLIYSNETAGTKKHKVLTLITAGLAGGSFILQLLMLLELHDMLIPIIVSGIITTTAAAFIPVNVNECRRHEFRLTAYTAERLFKSAVNFVREYKYPVKRTVITGFAVPAALITDTLIYLRSGCTQNSVILLILMLIEGMLGGVFYIRAEAKRREELRIVRTQALVNQIKPHFIFNTMSSIYYLAQDDPDSVMPAIDHFTEYLQANFKAFAESEPVPFDQEEATAKAYLKVEKLLRGDTLSITWDTPYRDFRLPSLSLQPLVENAVKHGYKNDDETPLSVTIRTGQDEKKVFVSVTDNGQGIKEDELDIESGTGALKNVSDRIKLSLNGTLTVRRTKDGGTESMIILPAE